MEVTASGLVTQRFLRGMPARQLDALAETASEVMFPARHRIFAAGGYADKFWLIQSGRVALDVLVPGEGLAVIGWPASAGSSAGPGCSRRTSGRSGGIRHRGQGIPIQRAGGAHCEQEYQDGYSDQRRGEAGIAKVAAERRHLRQELLAGDGHAGGRGGKMGGNGYQARARLAGITVRGCPQGAAGVAVMVAALLTPFSRGRRGRWGAAAAAATRQYPGDELVREPRWGWTHVIGIDAPAESVWPWVAQVGADRGGFYSYQWLENLIGCQLRNAATIHPQWAAREGGELRLHPNAPPLRTVTVQPGRALVAYIAPVRAMSSTRQAESPAPGRGRPGRKTAG